MRKPDHVFTITVHLVYVLVSCDEKQAEEAKGLFGWHPFTTCKACKLIFNGYELWGENGHCQGHISRGRNHLAACLRMRASKQWVAQTDVEYPKGALIGYRFKVGGPLYYRG